MVGATYICGPGNYPGSCSWCGAGLSQLGWSAPECNEECGFDLTVELGPVESSGFGPVSW